MTCHEARDLFSALIDETLTREQRADVYGHLTTCAECRRELTALERTVALVRGATPVRAPAGFVDRVLAAARPVPWYVRVARAALLPWPVKVPLGAAAVVLVAGLAVLMFRGSQEQQQAARHEPRPLSDRAAPPASGPPVAPSMPAAPPPASAPEVTSRPRADSTPEADRAAGVASRVEEEAKREQTPAALESRDKVMAKRAMRQSQPASAPDVVARLETPDRDTAERGLAALVARLAGEIIARHFEGEAMTVELAIPGDRYEDFIREAGRIGTLRVETERPAQAGRLRIVVHFGTR
jgi:anti-sigma factor RsiW